MSQPTPSFDFITSTRVHCGIDAAKKVGEICIEWGRRVLVVADKSVPAAEQLVVEQIRAGKLEYRVVYLESPEPTIDYIDGLAKELKNERFDVIVGVGGGSAVDLAKSLSIALTQSESIWMYANLSYRPSLPLLKPTIPIIAVPTTSGTGAEMTPYAVLTNEENQQKGTVQERAIMPKVALLDPELCWTMPAELTAATGLDAFAHALEATINTSKFAPVAEWAGKEAMRVIFKALPRAYKEPADRDARQQMAWAAAVAGIAITHRGTTVCHAIAETMGGMTHIPHGKGVAISTLPVLKKTAALRPEVLGDLFNATQEHTVSGKSAEYRATAFVDVLTELTEKVGMNRTAASYLGNDVPANLPESILNKMMEYKFRPLKQHPIEFSQAQLGEIIAEVVNG